MDCEKSANENWWGKYGREEWNFIRGFFSIVFVWKEVYIIEADRQDWNLES